MSLRSSAFQIKTTLICKMMDHKSTPSTNILAHLDNCMLLHINRGNCRVCICATWGIYWGKENGICVPLRQHIYMPLKTWEGALTDDEVG